MAHASADEVKKHVKTYIFIFVALLILTAITVAVAEFHLPLHLAVVLAMAVASVKGTLVALFFMHLNHEKRIIYASLGLTATLFFILMCIPFFI